MCYYRFRIAAYQCVIRAVEYDTRRLSGPLTPVDFCFVIGSRFKTVSSRVKQYRIDRVAPIFATVQLMGYLLDEPHISSGVDPPKQMIARY